MPQFVPPGPFTGASAGLPGSSGLVPAPIAGQQGRVLTGDGIWSALVDNVGAAPVQSVNTRTGAIVLTKTDVGLANVDNTSDANKPVSTATTAAINAHANNTLNPHSVTKAQVGLGSVNNTSDVDKPVSTAQAAADTAVANAAASALSAHTSSTSNPHSVTKAQVGLGNADNTSDANKPVSTATQTALDLKANANDATLTGSPVATTASLGNNSTRIATTAFVTAAVAAGGGGGSGTSTRFTVEQTAHGFSAEQVVYNNGTAWVLARADATATAIGLGVIESVTANDFVLVVGGVMTLTGKTANTQYYLSAATAGLLTSTAPTNAAHFIVRIVKTNSTTSGLVEVGEPLALGLIANADLAEMTAGSVKANVTGSTGPASDVDIDTAFKTALALAKADVGLSNVDNTSDANKPVSTATQTALDLKANAANAALTGTPTAPTAPGGTSTTQLATTAFVATAISGVGGIPTGALAFWPTSAIGSPPTGFTPANGSNGTTNESAIGGLSIIAKHGGTVATPTFSPAAGQVASGTDISILCATSNVVIRYTTGDGSQAAPTRSTGTVYSAPIDMTAAATLKAIAYRTPDTPSELMLNSSVASAAYTITPSGTNFVTGRTLGTARTDGANYFTGFRFTVGASNITVSELGRYCASGSSGSHPIYIADNTGAAVVSGSIDASTGANDWVFTSVTPTVLTAGQTYDIMAQEVTGGDTFYGDNTTITTTAVATVTHSCYGTTSIGGSVTTNNPGTNAYGPVTFKYSSP